MKITHFCLIAILAAGSFSGLIEAASLEENSNFNSATIRDSISAPIDGRYAYTPWELLHRTPMLAGFVWG